MKKISQLLCEAQKRESTKIGKKTIEEIFLRCIFNLVDNLTRGELQSVSFSPKTSTIAVYCNHPIIAAEIWINKEKVIKIANDEIGSKVIKGVKIAV